jgi:hypothetical protein
MAFYTSKFKPTPVFMKDFYLQYYTVVITSSVALTDLPVNYLYICNSASAITITLPSAVNKDGCVLFFKNVNTGNVTVDGNGSQTIDGQLTQILPQYSSFELVAFNGNWFIK